MPEEAGGRGAAREDAILRATLTLLARDGYDQMTIDAVAAQARASKATIYRRWPGKAALVVAAVRRHGGQPEPEVPDTGDLRADLLAVLTAMRASLKGQDAALLLGLLAAMRRDAALAEAVRDQVTVVKRGLFDEIIRRAAARGDVSENADAAMLAEVSSAVLFSRLLVTGQGFDDRFAEHFADTVLLPIATSETTATSAKERSRTPSS